MNEEKVLDIKMEAERLKKLYEDDPHTESFNAIIYGGVGSGKSSLLRTCRLPLHVDSFDPGGSKVLMGEAILNGTLYEDEMKKGNIIVDSRFENEDPKSPSSASLWDTEFQKKKRMGYFNHIGTYAIDSMTTWSQVIMYEILKKAVAAKPGKRVMGAAPQENDWLPQMTVIENAMRSFVSLPCDCILLGHDDFKKDEPTGRMFVNLMITGKLRVRVPLLFDEIYYAMSKETSSETIYQLLTKKTGMYEARSRLSNKGQLNMYEVADIKAILKKVGRRCEDKPSLMDLA
jgi:hypothetical protein